MTGKAVLPIRISHIVGSSIMYYLPNGCCILLSARDIPVFVIPDTHWKIQSHVELCGGLVLEKLTSSRYCFPASLARYGAVITMKKRTQNNQ